MASDVRWRSIPRICEKIMTSFRTILPCCSSFALARCGNPQQRKGGGRTTRAPVARRTWRAAIETVEDLADERLAGSLRLDAGEIRLQPAVEVGLPLRTRQELLVEVRVPLVKEQHFEGR
jgi:hypothetical protein